MSQTETSEAEAIDPERGTPAPGALEHTPEEDPAVSPTEGHHRAGAHPAGADRRPPCRAQTGADPRTGHAASSWPRSAGSVTRSSAAMAGGSGLIIVLLVVFVGVFLLWLALPSLRQNTANFLTSRNWIVVGDELSFGIAGLLWTTALTAVMAMVLAVPVAVGVALFLTQYVHKRVSGPLSFVVDLLAAVPSIIFGLWGLTVLGPFISPAGDWLIANLGFIPLFASGVTVKSSVFVAGVVLAIMILPIVTAISRDVFAQTPRDHVEAAYALGATRWEMIRTAVLPYGRSGVISASMLGLGRALGETIAVMIILTTPAPGIGLQPVDLRRRGDLRQQDRQQRRRVRQPVQDRGLHRRRPGAVRGHLRGERVGPGHRRPREREVMTTTSPAPTTSKPLSFRRPSGPRTIKNALAYVYVTLAAVLAVIPLVWVLYTVISKGARLVLTSTWWTQSQRGITPPGGGWRRLPRHRRHHRDRADLRGDRRAAGRARGDPADRVRPRHQGGPGGQLHRGHPQRHPLDRGRAVHLRAVHHHLRLSAAPCSRWAWPWCC